MKPFRFLRKTFTLLALTLLVTIVLNFSSTNTALAKGMTTASPTNTSFSDNVQLSNQDLFTVLKTFSSDFTTSAQKIPLATFHTNVSLSTSIQYLIIYANGNSIGPNLVKNCGWASCSLYFSRKETREIAEWGPVGAEILGYIPGWVGVIINWAAVAVQTMAGVASVGDACLRVRYGALWGLYVDHSGYCHNT